MFYTNQFFCFLLVMGSVVVVHCLNFSYQIIPIRDSSDFLFIANSSIAADALQVTYDSSNADMSNLYGRVCYKEKLKLWREMNQSVASFNTTFELNIKGRTEPGGEGMAFILTADVAIPDNSQGQWLGIVNATTNGSKEARIVAVEFDTMKSYTEDVDNNHLGLNINSIKSILQVPLRSHGVELLSGVNVKVIVQYHGKSKTMDIFVSMSSGTEVNTTNPTLSADIDLTEYLPEDVYIGFSASTGSQVELNCVKSWSFSSTNVESGDTKQLLWLWIMIPTLVFVLLCGFAGYLGWKREERKKKRPDPYIIHRLESSTASSPCNFRLKELKSATRNFDPVNKLGKGGFGTVYKGFLKQINMEVAIKRVSKDSRQGKEEFLSEVTTISHLEHKNLVKLFGWCYENDELLLIYKLMPNGSLDKFIYPAGSSNKAPEIILSWEIRLNIICGVASALDYLHDGCEKRVLHRDVKASNVMLDAEYNAKLGDFGLARTVQQDGETHYSTKGIAGTYGYMAPECFLTNRATVETDVYGFGVFVLEVSCGRRPGKKLQKDQNHQYVGNYIIDWVWDLHSKEQIHEAMDPRLELNFDKDQTEVVLMLGLACCHPNPNKRPSMKVALQILKGDTAPPILPSDKPAFMWPAMDFPEGESVIYFGGGILSQSTELSGR